MSPTVAVAVTRTALAGVEPGADGPGRLAHRDARRVCGPRQGALDVGPVEAAGTDEGPEGKSGAVERVVANPVDGGSEPGELTVDRPLRVPTPGDPSGAAGTFARRAPLHMQRAAGRGPHSGGVRVPPVAVTTAVTRRGGDDVAAVASHVDTGRVADTWEPAAGVGRLVSGRKAVAQVEAAAARACRQRRC